MRPMSRSDPRADGATELEALKADSFGRIALMRGADGVPWGRLPALPAFWVGLLYDDAALDAAWDLVRDFSVAERHALRDGAPRHGLKLPFRNGTLLDLAREAAAERGMTVMIVLHDLQAAARVSDRIVVMAKGRLVAFGTPDEAITPDILAEVYRVSARVQRCDRGVLQVMIDDVLTG